MEAFRPEHAVTLIQTALQSKAIDLKGPSSTASESEKLAKSDATYLLTLLKELTKKPAE